MTGSTFGRATGGPGGRSAASSPRKVELGAFSNKIHDLRPNERNGGPGARSVAPDRVQGAKKCIRRIGVPHTSAKTRSADRLREKTASLQVRLVRIGGGPGGRSVAPRPRSRKSAFSPSHPPLSAAPGTSAKRQLSSTPRVSSIAVECFINTHRTMMRYTIGFQAPSLGSWFLFYVRSAGFRCRVSVLGCIVLGFQVSGSGFRVSGFISGFVVPGSARQARGRFLLSS